jgi:hypothetical protein
LERINRPHSIKRESSLLRAPSNLFRGPKNNRLGKLFIDEATGRLDDADIATFRKYDRVVGAFDGGHKMFDEIHLGFHSLYRGSIE